MSTERDIHVAPRNNVSCQVLLLGLHRAGLSLCQVRGGTLQHRKPFPPFRSMVLILVAVKYEMKQ